MTLHSSYTTGGAASGSLQLTIACRDCDAPRTLTLRDGDPPLTSWVCMDCLKRRNRPPKEYPHE